MVGSWIWTKPYFPCHWCTVLFLCNEKVMSSFSSVQILMLVGQYVTYRTAVWSRYDEKSCRIIQSCFCVFIPCDILVFFMFHCGQEIAKFHCTLPSFLGRKVTALAAGSTLKRHAVNKCYFCKFNSVLSWKEGLNVDGHKCAWPFYCWLMFLPLLVTNQVLGGAQRKILWQQ